MTPTPNPRVQDLPMIRSDLAALAQQTRRIALQIQGADELSLDHLKQMTKSMHVVFDFLEGRYRLLVCMPGVVGVRAET